MAIADTARFSPTSHVLSRTLAGEAVLLDLGGGQYFGLDEVGTLVWEALDRGETLGEASAGVVARYEVAPEVARADVEALVTELLERALLTKVEP